MHGQLTKKADVYSFGVLLLVIVCGRSISKASEPDMDQFLLEQAWRLHEEGKLAEMVDDRLREYPEEEVVRYMKVALFCTQAAAGRRPSMPQVLRMLSRPIRLNEAELTPPAILLHDSGQRSKEYGSSHSKDSSSSVSSAAQLTTAPATFTDMVGR